MIEPRKRGYHLLIGNRFRRLRERRGLNQWQQAAELGMGQSSLSRLEGQARAVGLYEAIDLCAHFNITLDELLLPPMGAWEEKILEQGSITPRMDIQPKPEQDPWIQHVEKERKKRQKE